MIWEEEVQKKGVTNISPLAKGKRSIVYEGEYNSTCVIIKTKHPDSQTPARMEIEAQWLQLLNTHNIAPHFLFSGKEYLVYEKVEGDLILDYLKNATQEKILTMLGKLYDVMYAMDKLGINKEEMHHPVKHVLIQDTTPHLIDFERCNRSFGPHNVTQLCQFITSTKVTPLLVEKNIHLTKEDVMKSAQRYKAALRLYHSEKNEQKLPEQYKELRVTIKL